MESEIPESAGLAEESNEERKAAKKGFFPSSMGWSFLVPKETRALTVTVSWGRLRADGNQSRRREGGCLLPGDGEEGSGIPARRQSR